MKKQRLLPVILILLALAPAVSAVEERGRLGQLFEQIVALLAVGSSELGEAYPPGGLTSEIEKDANGLGIQYPPGGISSPGTSQEIGEAYPPHGVASPSGQTDLGPAYPPHG